MPLPSAKLPLRASDWPRPSLDETLVALATATPDDRRQRRWNHALAALASDRPEEALGALTVMAQDEPDLRLLGFWRLAAARARIALGDHADALALLDDFAMRGNPEACAWRLLALAGLEGHALALSQLGCAQSAILSRSPSERRPFVHAAMSAAIASGRAGPALRWLRLVPDDAQKRLLAGEALLALKRHGEAARMLRPLAAEGVAEPLRVRAEAALVEAELASGRITAGVALGKVQSLRFAWRGDRLEQRLTVLAWDLALAARRPRVSLDAAATLLRYHPGEPRLPGMLRLVTATFTRWLQPGAKVPLPLAAGLIWDHRDLMPGGASGDALVRQLAARLAAEGLHARAADLLEHQLAARARDVAQGPLSIEVAQLQLLAGKPARSLDAIRRTADTLYPPDIAEARLRMEAIALYQLGQQKEAIALLEGAQGTADLRAELYWRKRDWAALASAPLPPPGQLNEVAQVRLLRRAIALGMVGDEAGLLRLRQRYASAFVGLASASAFAVLTAARGEVTGEQMSSALAALPSASPAGADAELLDLVAIRQRQAPPAPRG